MAGISGFMGLSHLLSAGALGLITCVVVVLAVSTKVVQATG